jgi:hypothetical protein
MLGCLEGSNPRQKFPTARRRSVHARTGDQSSNPTSRAQGLLTWQDRAAPANQQPKSVLEPLGQRADREEAHARRGQFDCERNPVQTPAHRDERAALIAAVAHYQARRDVGRTIQEQLHGRNLAQLLERRQRFAVDLWDGERLQPLHALAAEVQRLPTRRQDAHLRAIGQQSSHCRRGRIEHVLAAIEHQ